MKLTSCLLIFAPLFIVGCTSSGPSTTAPSHAGGAAEEETIKKNLDKLSPEDRKLAEEQRFCAVQSKNRLGSMDEPQKVTLNGEKVFLCCDHCKKEAEAHSDKYAAKAKELREQNSKK